MDYVPIMLRVCDRTVVILGGGQTAARKARSFVGNSRRIIVIASEFCEDFPISGITRIETTLYAPEEVENYLDPRSIVIIATDDDPLNDAIEIKCKERGIMYNRVDDCDSDFIFPAVAESNGVLVAVSTLGKSPSFAGFLRSILKEELEKYSVALPAIERLRNNVLIPDLDERAKFFKSVLADSEFWRLVKEGRLKDAVKYGRHMEDLFLSGQVQ